jgi:multidrug efflux pump subunit AcrA (membrane-fusion protein)
MKKKVKLIGGAALVLVLITAAVLYSAMPMKIGMKTLSSATANVTFTEQGTYDYSDSYQVYPIVSGELLEVYVKKGDTVKKGDKLALVCATQYESQIAQMESSVKGYNAQIDDLRVREQQEKEELGAMQTQLLAQMQTLRAQISEQRDTEASLDDQIQYQETAVGANKQFAHYAGKVVKEARDMYGNDDPVYIDAQQGYASARSALASSMVTLEQLKNGVLPEDYYDGQIAALQSQIDSVKNRLGKSYIWPMVNYYQSQIEGTQAGIDQLREMLGKATITAPVDGVIRETALADTNLVSQAAHVAEIGRTPLVEAYVSTRYLDGVKVKDRVELKVEKQLGDETVGATVTFIDNKAEARLSSLGIEERKVRVLVAPDAALTVGTNVDVDFVIYSQPDAIVVPKAAVFEKDGQDYVWLADNGVLKLRAVRRGVETREGYIVSEGLAAGDQVVSDANQQKLAEGKKVTAA